MSAVDDYRKFNYVVQFGGHILPEDIAVLREVFIKMERRADAAIAELGAEQAAAIEARELWHGKYAEALAELAALKGQCCDNCGWTTCWIWAVTDLSPSWRGAEEGIMCRLWTARAEEGGGE